MGLSQTKSSILSPLRLTNFMPAINRIFRDSRAIAARKYRLCDLTLNEVRKAAKLAYDEQDKYRKKVIAKGNEIIEKAEKEGKKIMVLGVL